MCQYKILMDSIAGYGASRSGNHWSRWKIIVIIVRLVIVVAIITATLDLIAFLSNVV